MTEWKEVFTYNVEQPEVLDTTSDYTIRERKDFNKVTYKVPVDPEQPEGETKDVFDHWEYLEREMTISEFTKVQNAKISELEKQIQEMAETTMLSFVDLYELQLEAMGELEY